MTRNALQLRPLLLATALYLNACSYKPAPLSPSASASAMANASITVSVLDGAAPVNGKAVALIAPDGSKQVLNTGSGGNATGEARFEGLNIEGRYSVGFEAQASVAPALSQVYLSSQSPQASVTLQAGGSALLITPAPFQNNWYPWAAQQFNYTLTYSNESDLQADLALSADSASLPAGWNVVFSAPLLRKGETAVASIFTADGTTGTVQTKFVGRAGSQQVEAFANLNSNWAIYAYRFYTSRSNLIFHFPNSAGDAHFHAFAKLSITGKNLPSAAQPVIENPPAQVTAASWSSGLISGAANNAYFYGASSVNNALPLMDGTVYDLAHHITLTAAFAPQLWNVWASVPTVIRIGTRRFTFVDEIHWANYAITGTASALTTF